MADIFISYASDDLQRVESLAKELERQGWSIFWDRTIPVRKSWLSVLQSELETAKCVVVIWTENSLKSKWVLAEVNEAYEKDILTQVLFENIDIPFPFKQEQAADLIDWTTETDHSGYNILLSAISELTGPSPLKIKEAEQTAAEEKRKQKETEAKRKAEEEERKRKDVEAERKAEEEQKRREAKAEIKPDKPEPDAIAAFESRKSRNTLIVSSVAGVIVLLMVVIGIYFTKGTIKEPAPAQVQKEVTTQRKSADSAAAPPAWVMKGSGAFDVDGSKVFYGVGAASGIKNKALLQTTSDNRARAEIVKILEIYVASLAKDYMTATPDGDQSASSEEQHVETALKTFTKTTLSGATIIDRWIDPEDRTMYSLCELDLADFTKTLYEYKELDKIVRNFVRKNAERLHNELERMEGR